MALNYLLDPVFQIENSAGKPATDGWLEVYIHGTRTKYYCASDFNGTLHPFKIPLDSLGSNIVLAEDGQSYDVYAYNRFGSLLMSRYNVQPGSGGSGSGGEVGSMQHWMGMYGPTYTHFPGDNAGHTLGIPRQSVDYDGDFIDHIETAPYPDGAVPAYIYLKPGLYHIDCVIRYQQSNEDVKNTLDEVLIYTGHGNANEDVAYQLDASGPDTNGNRHCLKQSFIRKVTENDGRLLYFAPGTPTDWTDAYIQTLSIVKLDSIALSPTIVQGLEKVTHDATMTGDGTVMNPLSIQDALDGKQDVLVAGDNINIDSDGKISATLPEEEEVEFEELDLDDYQKKLTAGDGITIDSDGVISAEGEKYNEGWGILIDSDNEISVDPSIIQKKITAGDGIQIDSDGTISADLPEEEEVEFEELNLDDYQKKLTAGDNINIDSDGVISAVVPDATNIFWCVYGTTTYAEMLAAYNEGKHLFLINGNLIAPLGRLSNGYFDFYYVTGVGASGGPIFHRTSMSPNGVWGNLPTSVQSDWNETDRYEAGFIRNKPNLSQYQKELTADYGIDLDSDGNIGVDPNIIPELPPILPLVAGENVTIEDSDGVVVISADGGGSTYTAGEGINITSDGVISADLPEEEEVEFEELDLDDYQKKLTAGQNIEIDSDGVISATSEPCLWFLDSDGYVQPKDGKNFEVYGVPSYETYWDYYYAKLNRVKSDNIGLRVDYMVASHRGDASTPFGPFNVSATLRTDHSANPYQGSRKAGLVLDDNQTGTGINPRARIDMYAGSNGGYSLSTYRDQTYVQAIVANDYVRMRSDDIIRHAGSTDGHAPFILAHQSDTAKTYVMQPTATAGIYELVEETSGGGTYTAGEGIDIDSDGVISVKVGFINM